MKSLSAKFGAIVLVAGLIFCAGDSWSADWKEFAEATTGVFLYDEGNVRTSSEGFVRVWIHNETKQETSLVEFNCKAEGYRVLDVVEYDNDQRIKGRHDYYDNPEWLTVSSKSVLGPLRKMVCR